MAQTLPATMHTVELRSYAGTPDALAVVERPLPQPGSGEVLVRIAAAPINPSDLMFLRGRYGLRKELPIVPGLEGSGVVVAGKGLYAQALVGRAVACTAPNAGDGTWAEYMLTPANFCFPLRRDVSLLRGATALVNPATAWALLDLAQRAGHRAAVHTAAASSVGQMIVRLSRTFGLPVIHIVRRPAQVALLRSLGADYVLDSSAATFHDELRDLSRRLEATIAFDAVAGSLTGQLLQALPRGAEVVVYGALAGNTVDVDVGELIFKQKQLTGFWLADWFRQQSPLTILRTAATIQRQLNTELRTTVRACLPLAEVQRGLDLYTADMSAGKVLLMPGLHRPEG